MSRPDDIDPVTFGLACKPVRPCVRSWSCARATRTGGVDILAMTRGKPCVWFVDRRARHLLAEIVSAASEAAA